MNEPMAEMTYAASLLILDMLNVEAALQVLGDREGLLLAAGLREFRRGLEAEGGLVRRLPEPEPACLKPIRIERGNGWLKLVDTRGEQESKGTQR